MERHDMRVDEEDTQTERRYLPVLTKLFAYLVTLQECCVWQVKHEGFVAFTGSYHLVGTLPVMPTRFRVSITER